MILQGNTYIRQLDEEEIAGMRVACKLGREVSIPPPGGGGLRVN
jgi:hypothetical protein